MSSEPVAAAAAPAAKVAAAVNKKRKIVSDGLFHAELNQFLQRELGEEGYAGVEVRVTPLRTEIIIRATRTQNVLGEKGRRIRELTSLVQKRFQFAEGTVELYAERYDKLHTSTQQKTTLNSKCVGVLRPSCSDRSLRCFTKRSRCDRTTSCCCCTAIILHVKRAAVIRIEQALQP